MTRRLPGFLTLNHVLIIMSVALMSARAAAAQAVGAGDLTSTVAVTEPTSGVFDWGVVKLAPGLVIDEAGHDSNVFNERENPKDDWLFRGKPDLSLFSAVRFAKLSVYGGTQLSYFKTYTDENSVGYEYRGRLDLLISRIRPYIGYGQTRSRERPNGEIDSRADQKQEELSSGLAFGLGPHSQVYAGVVRARQKFYNSVEEGVPLSEALNHDGFSYTAGVQTDITPLATLTLSGNYVEERFESAPLRNGNGSSVTAGMLIGAEAVLSGTIEVSYLNFEPVDPTVKPFRGLTMTAGVAYPFLEIGRLNLSFIRGMEYSFDQSEGYYVENSAILSYTHRILGDVDVQVRGAKSWFDYGFKDTTAPRTDTLAAAAGSVGYNLRNRTRISLNYEVTQRRSPAFEERNYDRTRVYLSWAYAF